MKVNNLNIFLPVIIVLLFLSGCRKNMTDYTLRRNDMRPFGVYIAFNGMKEVFPDAFHQIADKSPYLFEPGNIEGKISINDSYLKSNTAYFILHDYINVSVDELEALDDYVNSGNFLFISSNVPPAILLEKYSLKTNSDYTNYPDSLLVSINHPDNGSEVNFAYPAYNYDAYFTSIGSEDTEILGRNRNGEPNFIKINNPSNGAIFIHLAPSAFTNYFLLYNNNFDYFNFAMSYIPEDIEVFYWDDYFLYKKYSTGSSSESFSALALFRENEILKWAYWIAIGILISLLLLETSRRQRVISIKPQLQNTSLNFIRTIGNLYFQKRNNNDLGYKMTIQFMDYSRTRYQVSSVNLNSEFIERLSEKSGYDIKELEEIVKYAKLIKDNPNIADEILLAYNQLLERFYKHK